MKFFLILFIFIIVACQPSKSSEEKEYELLCNLLAENKITQNEYLDKIYELAQQGFAQAQYEIGIKQLSLGNTAKLSEDIAQLFSPESAYLVGIEHLEKASAQNHIKAKEVLLAEYFSGNIVEKNYQKAFQLAEELTSLSPENSLSYLMLDSVVN